MKKVLLSLVMAFMLSFSFNQANAAPKKKNADTEEKSSSSADSHAHDGGYLGGTFALLSGTAGVGGTFGYLFEVGENFSAGVESGFYYWSQSAGSLSASVWVIPIMPTFRYFFPSSKGSVIPFVGVSAGIGITSGSVSSGSASASATQVNFEGLLHLGLEFGGDKHIFIDPKIGIINSSFVFLPTVGVFF